MNILLIGSGGREHALAWAISASPLCDRLFIAPGNPGTARCGTNVDLSPDDHAAIIAFCEKEHVEFVVVGPEAPLVAGIVDALNDAGIRAFGPTKAAAQLEGSKAYTKELCRAAHIPTGAFARFTTAQTARHYVEVKGAPIVIKADGLAAGKGVVVAMTEQDALDAIDMMFSGGLGAAGTEVVIEEFLEGEEVSFFALVDGENCIALASAQDHKRVGDGDTGPNTGGMGAYSPAPIMTPVMEARVMTEIIRPTVAEMQKRGTPFKGVLFAGLMITKTGPQLIEYNVRFGDPECEVLMPRLKSDIVAALLASADGVLKNFDLRWHDHAALTVIYAADGYPGTPRKGTRIRNLDQADILPDVHVFHAGTALKDGALIANGGRVLAVTGIGADVKDAQKKAYDAIARIDWPEGFYRKDIGWRAIARE